MLHAKPHEMPSHVALALGTDGHGPHAAPHVVDDVLLTHEAPHRWKPLLQAA